MSDMTSEHEGSLKRFRWKLQTFQLYIYRRLNSRNIFKMLLCLILVFVLLFFYSTNDNVPRDHLDFSQSWFDRLEVLSSRWAEMPTFPGFVSPPYYSNDGKLKRSQWDNFNEGKKVTVGSSHHEMCPVIKDPFLVWVLKTPKSASSTLQDLITALHGIHPERYAMNNRQIRINRASDRDLVVERYKEYFKGLNRRTVFSAHGWFLNLERRPKSSVEGKMLVLPSPLTATGGLSFRPVYIGTLRDPLKRLISHYEYLHEGPRSMASIERHGQVSEGIPDFPTCVARFMQSVDDGLSEEEADKWNCMHWANIQLKYFCGYDDYDVCAAAGKQALDIAMNNIHRYFLVVGLVERFEDMLVVLQEEIPLFKGISKLYAERGSSRVNTKSSSKARRFRQLRQGQRQDLAASVTRTINHQTSEMLSGSFRVSKPPTSKETKDLKEIKSRVLSSTPTPQNISHANLAENVKDFLMSRLRYEQKLYNYAEARFDIQMERCSKSHHF